MQNARQDTFFAHSGRSEDGSDWQTLLEHLEGTAARAATAGERLGLPLCASIAARFHDFGKYDPAFQRRLSGDKTAVDHSTAGAHLLLGRAGPMPHAAQLLASGSVDRNTRNKFAPTWRCLSLPIRERGSKLRWAALHRLLPQVAPHPGAWIETARGWRWPPLSGRRSPSGSVDRNAAGRRDLLRRKRRSPSGSVDRNLNDDKAAASRARGRSPSGSVDRNRM